MDAQYMVRRKFVVTLLLTTILIGKLPRAFLSNQLKCPPLTTKSRKSFDDADSIKKSL